VASCFGVTHNGGQLVKTLQIEVTDAHFMGGLIEELALEPIQGSEFFSDQSYHVGAFIALFAFFGTTDLIASNVFSGFSGAGKFAIVPVDLESTYSRVEFPWQTQLISPTHPEKSGIPWLSSIAAEQVQTNVLNTFLNGYMSTASILQEAVLLPELEKSCSDFFLRLGELGSCINEKNSNKTGSIACITYFFWQHW
jgi:hypothetical protein